MRIKPNDPLDKKSLKEVYLKLAKEYHPDSGTEGCDEKFKLLQEAYEKLSTYSKPKTQAQQQKYEDFFRDTYGAQNPYQDEHTREKYEQWRKEMFSKYSQAKHEEFLRQRYHERNYQNPSQGHQKHDFNSSSHFDTDPEPMEKDEHQPFNKPLFQTNSRVAAFFFNSKYRSNFYWYYREEIFAFMICFAIAFNLAYYYWLMTRREPSLYRKPTPNLNNYKQL